jgi:hypothetical protein
MTRCGRIVAAGLLSLLVSSAPASAHAPGSFYDIEHVVGEDARLTAEQALTSRIAGVGTPVGAAERKLEEAGATFIGRKGASCLEFVYVSAEVTLLISVRQRGGLVTASGVRRDALGG